LKCSSVSAQVTDVASSLLSKFMKWALRLSFLAPYVCRIVHKHNFSSSKGLSSLWLSLTDAFFHESLYQFIWTHLNQKMLLVETLHNGYPIGIVSLHPKACLFQLFL
jgi:hypothetical protein